MPLTAQEALQTALGLEREGRLAEAQAFYHLLCRELNGHADALAEVATVAERSGQLDTAMRFMRQAIAIAPERIAYRLLLATMLVAAQRVAEAIAEVDSATRLDPGNADAHNTLGNLLESQGRLPQAIAAYRAAIAAQADRFEAYNNLGVALSRTGDTAGAIEAFRHALAISPDQPQVLNNLGAALRETANAETAVAALQRALQLQSEFPQALFNLGNALQDLRRHEEAATAYQQALAQQPDNPEATLQLGIVLRQDGKIDEAIRVWREGIDRDGDDPQSCFNLGLALGEREQHAEAAEWYRRGLVLQPHDADMVGNFGRELIESGRLEEGVAACRQAIALKPDFAAACSNAGKALRDLGRLDEAMELTRRAIELQPNFADALNNLANCYNDQCRYDEALPLYRSSIAANPGYAMAHVNLGIVLLTLGQYEEGWREYEWRLHGRERRYSQPLWGGSALNGRTILVHAEQGAGDTLQFSRFIPPLARQGRVILECQSELVRLLKSINGVSGVVAPGDPAPSFDVHCPLMSLPRLLNTRLETIPHQVPYLKPPPDLVQLHRRMLSPAPEILKVGINWAGNPAHKNDRNRSIPLSLLTELASIRNVQWISLQKGPAAEQATGVANRMNLLTPRLEDFADTAALLQSLDLILTVDTSVAHLAGALGRRTWIMLPFAPDWRWLLSRTDSPWHPTARLFRQPQRGGWAAVVEQVHRQLEKLAGCV